MRLRRLRYRRFVSRHPNLGAALESVRVWWSDVQLFWATVISIVYVLLHLPWIRDYVPASFDLNLLLPLILILILWQTVDITKRLEFVETGIRGVSGSIESVVLERIQKSSARSRTLDVLALSLQYGWSGPRRWISDGQMNGWTVNLCAYLPENPPPFMPATWFGTAVEKLSDAHAFNKRADLRKNRIQINTYAYTHAPPVHGYRFGNGDILVAYVGWTKDGKLNGERARYELIPRRDSSPHAQEIRAFFTSWLEAAMATKFEPPSGASVNPIPA